MKKARQLLPEGLAEMPPGSELAAVLETIELSRLGGLDCVAVMRAQHRQASHEQARLMAAMVEVARCGVGPDERLPRTAAPDEFAADEIRAALAWTRRAADTQLGLAWDLQARLPDVFAALDAGWIDVPKSKVLSEWTQGLTDDQAREICARLLPEAPALTTGQLIDRVKRLSIAIDGDWARRRYEEAVRDRKVVGYRNEDGSANLCGYSLPADRAAAACANIDELAKKVKQAGDRRAIDLVRADLYLGMLDGSYVGWAETDIVAHMTSAARFMGPVDGEPAPRQAPCPPQPGGKGGRSYDEHHLADGRQDNRPIDQTPKSPSSDGGDDFDDPRWSADGQVLGGPWPPLHPNGPSARWAGVEIRAEITTLLGWDDHPAEIAGWGHVHADLARQLVRDQTDAEWRYALTGDDGRLLFEGITRHRPAGYPARGDAAARGGIVELHIPLSTLRRMAAEPARLDGWARLIADLVRQADRHEGKPPERGGQIVRPEAGRGGRSPGRVLRRRTQIRDRTCTHPGCRLPASDTDGDHTRDWADGGATRDENIGSLCRHDHRLKHLGGWQLSQPEPGHFLWTSRLGRRYYVRPPLIIQPLPDHIRRDPLPLHHAAPRYDPDPDHASIWREPSAPEPPPQPPPSASPADELPPF